MNYLDDKILIDDLITQYMLFKVKNGYEPYFYANELVSLINFCKNKINIEIKNIDIKKILKEYFEKKSETDWCIKRNWITMDTVVEPHMSLEYIKNKKDYVVKANYKLSYSDYINENLNSIISEFLKDTPKRKINENSKIKHNDLIISKYVSSQIIINIWQAFITEKIREGKWPKQCVDINKYLLELDLAMIIGLDSIKDPLFELYKILTKRFAQMYSKDRNIKISSCSNNILAKSNYDLLIQGNEKLFNKTFGPYKKCFEIDLTKNLTRINSTSRDYIIYKNQKMIDVIKMEDEQAKEMIKVLDKKN